MPKATVLDVADTEALCVEGSASNASKATSDRAAFL